MALQPLLVSYRSGHGVDASASAIRCCCRTTPATRSTTIPSPLSWRCSSAVRAGERTKAIAPRPVRARFDAGEGSHAASRRLTAASMSWRRVRALAHGPAAEVWADASPLLGRCRSASRSPKAAQRRQPRWPPTCGSPRRCDSPTPSSRRSLLVPSISAPAPSRASPTAGQAALRAVVPEAAPFVTSSQVENQRAAPACAGSDAAAPSKPDGPDR